VCELVLLTGGVFIHLSEVLSSGFRKESAIDFFCCVVFASLLLTRITLEGQIAGSGRLVGKQEVIWFLPVCP
jgi:hypothetical protein